jgi:MurNAc alpha-1-phosphate uridylyltransferase
MNRGSNSLGENSILSAIVLAAGFGVRMKPITNNTPKPLVKVRNQTLIDYVLDRLKDGGVNLVVVNLHYLGQQIEDHLIHRKDPKITFSWEKEKPLETGGGVKAALPRSWDTPFWVVNSDSIWLNGSTDAMGRMASIWDDEKMDGLLLLHSTVEAYGYVGNGDFNVDPNGIVTRKTEHEVVPWLFTGVQILHPRLFVDSPDGSFSLNQVYDQAIERERLYGVVHDGEWFHVGTLEGLAQIEGYMNVPYAGNKRR